VGGIVVEQGQEARPLEHHEHDPRVVRPNARECMEGNHQCVGRNDGCSAFGVASAVASSATSSASPDFK
jgi:hypothetical protein